MYRFAQFFISPLLKEDSVDREIQAVESGMKSTIVLQHVFVICILKHSSSWLAMVDKTFEES